jgi:hypothetical protein
MSFLDRRQCLSLLPASLLTLAACADRIPAPDRAGDVYGSSPEEVEAWISVWMSGSKAVRETLRLTRFKDPTYVLTAPIYWTPDPNTEQEVYSEVEVPPYFVTDFASIPRLFWGLLRPDGEYAYASVLHDYLYWTQERPRKEADDIFKFAMEDFGIDRPTGIAIYRAVRVGGGGAWDNNAALKRAGEKRLLKELPNDPTVTWEDWKRREGVFQ